MSSGAAVPFRLALLAVVVIAGVAPAVGPAVGASPVAGGGTVQSVDGSAAAPDAVQPGGFDQEFRVEVYANGSARWTFVYSRPLLNETAEENFREYARGFRTNETDLYRDFRTRARALARRGTNETNRTMDATAFRRDAYVGGPALNQGIVEMSFLWTEFAVSDGERVIVGDVFEGGLYIAPEQRFVVTWGPNLGLVRAAPNGSARTADSITWTGGEEGRQFLNERPRVVLTTASPTTTATAAETTTTGVTGNATTTTAPTGPAGSGTVPAAVGVVVLLLGLGAALAYRSGTLDGALGGSAAPPDGGDGDGPGDGAAAAAGGVDATDGEESASSETAAEPAVSEEALVSDEDRVVGLLEENGGRMKQVNIVEETDWSKSKVSMLLSEMEEEGTISKLRVGRENIISLAGHEPELANSPFEDEEE